MDTRETPTRPLPAPASWWRFAGACALAHVVLVFAGLALTMPPLFEDGTRGIREAYVDADLGRVMTGGLVEMLGFLLLVPAMVFLAHVLGVSSPAGRLAAGTGLACGLVYVAVTVAVGFPAGAAAAYGAHHGLDLDVALVVNNVRFFGYLLSLVFLGAHALGVAVSALADGTARRWVGGLGIVTGLALLAAPALGVVALHDLPTLLWFVWWVGLAVWLLRARPVVPSTSAPAPAPAHAGV
jgi:hypothetical protein